MPRFKRGHGWTHKKKRGPYQPHEYSFPHTVQDWYFICIKSLKLTKQNCKADNYYHPDRDDYEEYCYTGDACPCNFWCSFRRRLGHGMTRLAKLKWDSVPPIDLVIMLFRLQYDILSNNKIHDEAYSLISRCKHPDYPMHFL